jgi:hypothetical protein
LISDLKRRIRSISKFPRFRRFTNRFSPQFHDAQHRARRNDEADGVERDGMKIPLQHFHQSEIEAPNQNHGDQQEIHKVRFAQRQGHTLPGEAGRGIALGSFEGRTVGHDVIDRR